LYGIAEPSEEELLGLEVSIQVAGMCVPFLLAVFDLGGVARRFFNELFKPLEGIGLISLRDVVHGVVTRLAPELVLPHLK
jgi:hypothetical protein